MRELTVLLLLISTLDYSYCALSVSNIQLSLNGLIDQQNQIQDSISRSIGKPSLRGSIDSISKIGIDSAIAPSKAVLDQAIQVAKTASRQFDAIDKLQLNKGVDKSNSQTDMFGPHLLTNNEALEIGQIGDVFLQTATNTVKKLGIEPTLARESLRRVSIGPVIGKIRCPFRFNPPCNKNYAYRSADGSCNNLDHSLWGRANTPFERFIPGFYDDGIQSPRETSAVSGQKLPGARQISVKVHAKSTVSNEMDDVSHFAMEYGQFVSHDIQMNALSRGYRGSNMGCCKTPKRRNCLPISIDKDDPYFGKFRRRCMNMVRALATPNLECTLGQREQLNQNTHFLDGSHIYGSNSKTMESLRTKSGGKLKSTNNKLLPKDEHNRAACNLTNPHHKCFIGGDVRVNQQPMLMSLHTIWMKEHNRIATRLAIENPHWNDEKLFQEARKIVIAELQHITYNEYLKEILGNQQMQAFDLKPKTSGYFTNYNKNVKPQIRNSFSAAAFRFGHSMIRDKVAYRKSGQTTRQQYLVMTFLRPDLIYSFNGGVTAVTRGLYETFSQSVDRFLSEQVTNRLFERAAGLGGDLAAINIQRGRDHGMANYNTWRMVCGLKPAQTFASRQHGGLLDHDADAAKALSKAYAHPDDIDLFTGGVSEIPVNGGKVGPLFACIIGLQFKALKYGDRFFYESNNANVQFTPKQLNEIRKTTMARVICDNTDTDQLPPNVFRKASFPSNLNKRCDSFVKFDFQYWKDCVDGGWSSWTPVKFMPCLKRRRCNNPRPQPGCGKPCPGISTKNTCGGIGIGIGINPTLGPPRTLPPFPTFPPFRTIGPILPIRGFPRIEPIDFRRNQRLELAIP